jgi:hypothetical protein
MWGHPPFQMIQIWISPTNFREPLPTPYGMDAGRVLRLCRRTQSRS